MIKKKEIKIDILDKIKIPYVLKLSNRKTIRFSFDQEGNLIINAPQLIKIESLNTKINDHLEWIKTKHQDIFKKRVLYTNDSIQYFLGKKYVLKINYSKTTRVDLVNDLMMVSTNDLSKVRQIILKWRKAQTEIIITELLFQCYMKMEKEMKEYPKFEIRYSKRQLGACFYKQNKIKFNLALSVLPIYLIEYVIFHELNHFNYPNHSKQFHDNLKKYVTNERKCLNEIKEYNTVL